MAPTKLWLAVALEAASVVCVADVEQQRERVILHIAVRPAGRHRRDPDSRGGRLRHFEAWLAARIPGTPFDVNWQRGRTIPKTRPCRRPRDPVPLPDTFGFSAV
jgi:hypothetical protein